MANRGWKRSVFSESFNKSADSSSIKQSTRKRVKRETSKASPKTDHDTHSKTNDVPIKSSNDWTEVFEPKSTEELALHKKKYEELQQWFLDNNRSSFNNNKGKASRICLITGPAGSGKTAAVRALASKYQFQLQEWINPLDQDAVNSVGDLLAGDSYVVSHLATFKSFLFHASRYKSLLDDVGKRLLLIEDFPNALLNDAVAFEETLADYVDYGRSPLVFIVSDSKSRGLNISYNLFPDEVKQKYAISHISFNPIANTLMQKAVKRFSELIGKTEMGLENYKAPPQSMVDSIILSAQGDIRNAMINFHFAALKGAPDMLLMETHATASKGKSKSKNQTALKSVGRDESVTMLHALGRVFNPKYTDTEKAFLHSPELIAEAFSTEPKRFLDFIHANSLKHFSDIEHTVLAADCISIADVLLQEYRSNSLSTIGLNIATRGVMVANQKPVNGWLPVHGPKRLSHAAGKAAMPGIPANVYALDYAAFVRLIGSTKPK